MFKPCKFKKFSVLLLQKDAETVLSRLHEEELIEVRSVKLKLKDLEAFEVTEREKFASYNLTKIKRTLSILRSFETQLKPIEMAKKFLFEEEVKKIIAPSKFSELKAMVLEKVNPVAEKAEEIDKEIKFLSEKESELKEEREILESLRDLDIELEALKGFERIEIIIGKTVPEFEENILSEIKKTRDTRIIRVLGAKEKVIIFAIAIDKSETLLKNLRKIGFERIFLPERKGKPPLLLKKIEGELNKVEIEKNKQIRKARKLLEKKERMLQAIEELLEIEKSKQSAFSSAGKTEKTVNFDVFVPAKKEAKFRKILKESSLNRFYAEEVPFSEKEAPIMLSNPVFFRDYEFILKLYGLPEYNSIDPTPFIAIVFPLFFGLAFSDIGYGIMLVAFALFLRYTWGKNSESIKHLMNIMLHGGITTVFFGWVFGSLFGDMGGEGIKKMALLDPLGKTAGGESAALLFLGVIAFVGLMHLNIAVILGFREELRKKNYKAALAEKLVFVIMEGGLLLYLLGEFLNYGALISFAGAALLLLSLALFIIAGGPLGLMRITGFLGNTLSYLRLAALSLATFAVAMSINIIAGLISPIPYIGFVIAGLVLIIGHFANFLFNILSSFIHPLRLHCVEFFSYFYEGTGKEFQPFNVKRRFTEKTEVK